MNTSALVAVVIFAVVLLAIFGSLYLGALRSYRAGELDFDGIRLLRWAILGQLVIYALLGVTAIIT